MDVRDAIRARRNVRRYANRSISDHDLDAMLEAARRTPSSMNQQAWDFVVVTERVALEALSHVWRYAAHLAGSAATIALVAPSSSDPEEREIYQYDLGQVTMSIMLAATELGVGSCHAAVGEQDDARRILGVPDDHEVAMLVALGYPEARPLEPIDEVDRRPFDDVVHRERW